MEEKQVLAEIQKQERQLSTYWRSLHLSLIHISEPTRQAEISYAVFCLKKKKKKNKITKKKKNKRTRE